MRLRVTPNLVAVGQDLIISDRVLLRFNLNVYNNNIFVQLRWF